MSLLRTRWPGVALAPAVVLALLGGTLSGCGQAKVAPKATGITIALQSERLTRNTPTTGTCAR